MKFDKAYVIGSETISKKRIDNFYKKNKLKKIKINLWTAINGSNINIESYIKDGYLTKNFKMHMPGSLGCILSHITLWKHCIKDNNCDVALVLEDDVILNNNFMNTLDKISIDELPDDWEIIKLSYNKVIGKSFSKTFIKPKLNLNKGINAGSWCYLINTKNIQNVINILIPYNNKVSMDVIIRSNIDKRNIYFTKQKLAKHYDKKYSPRKDLNKPKKTLFELIKFGFRKYFYN